MNRMLFVCLLALVSTTGCTSSESAEEFAIHTVQSAEPVRIDPATVKVSGDTGAFTVTKKSREESPGLQLVTFSFEAAVASELKPISIRFHFPSVDVFGFWNPKQAVDKVNYYSSRFSSKASQNAPVLAYYNNALQNRITIALSDALNKSEMISYLKEEDVSFHPNIRLFQEKMPKTTSYEITLRIDTRPLPYHEVINDVASWWAKDPLYAPMPVPDGAKRPMYSTWYSYHQSITAKEIVAECRIAKSLGCGAVIVDDGWQTLDGNRGYAYTGDWTPDRIGDMRAFVDAVHKEGMQFLLWYSLPFMGEKAKNFDRFKGKFLSHWRSQGTYVLDPRYPEVREFIVETYVKAMNDWNLDGFKLDFIGRFAAQGDTKLTKENGRDFASVNEATDVLMTEVKDRLMALKPDILIEFRQPYIGPLMRKYGNMFRGVDAPNNAAANRNEVTNLRIMAQGTAVHSDMFIWRNEETVEAAALQILNILYSVPQLSVRLETVPEKHLAMIRHWFSYWNQNRDVLLDGEFIPSNPGANYPELTAVKGDRQISTVYEDVVVDLRPGIRTFDVINASSSRTVALRVATTVKGRLTITDCRGDVVGQNDVTFTKGLHSIGIPPSGMAELESKRPGLN